MAYDPNADTTTLEPSASDQASQQDLQDQYERQQTALPRPAPGGYGAVGGGTYLPPTPQPAARPAGLTRTPPPSLLDRRGPTFDDLDFSKPLNAGYGEAREAPKPEQGFTGDLITMFKHGAVGQLEDVLGAARYLEDKMGADPQTKAWTDQQRESVNQWMDKILDEGSPSLKKGMSASIFGGVDAQGNHVPTPGEVGWGTYMRANLLNLVPDVAMALLPATLVGKISVKALSLMGAAQKLAKAGGVAGQMATFGLQNMGGEYNSIAEELKKAPESEMMKSPAYAEMRRAGQTDEQAKEVLLKQAVDPMALGAALVGAAAGTGAMSLAARGVLARLGGSGRLLGAAVGGVEGGALMGGQAGANTALQQGFQQSIGTRQDLDTNAIAMAAARGALPGIAIGAGGGLIHPVEPRAKPAPTPEAKPPEGVAADAKSALDAALAPTPQRNPVREALTSQPAGFGAPGTGDQGEMFQPFEHGPTVAPGQPTPPPAPERTEQPPSMAPIDTSDRTPGPYAPQPPSPMMGEEGPTVVSRPPEPGLGMPGARQGEALPPQGTGATGPQAEMFRPIDMGPGNRAIPAGAGELPGEPEHPPGQAEMFGDQNLGTAPGREGEPPPPPGPTPPPAGGGGGAARQPAPDISAYASMKKSDLIDALRSHGETVNERSTPDVMRKRLAQLDAERGSTPTPPDTTSTAGVTPTPTAAERPRPGEDVVAPPVSETSLPPAPVGKTRVTSNQVQARDGVGHNEAMRRAAAENAAAEGQTATVPAAEQDVKTPELFTPSSKPEEKPALSDAQVSELKARGHGAVEIRNMTPEQAGEILAKPPEKTEAGTPGVFTPEQKAASDARVAARKAELEAEEAAKPKRTPEQQAAIDRMKASTAAKPAAAAAVAAKPAAAGKGRKKGPTVVIPEKAAGPQAYVPREEATAAPTETELQDTRSTELARGQALEDVGHVSRIVMAGLPPGTPKGKIMRDAVEELGRLVHLTDGSREQLIDVAQRLSTPRKSDTELSQKTREQLATLFHEKVTGKKLVTRTGGEPEPNEIAEVQAEEGARRGVAEHSASAEHIETTATGGGEGESAGLTMGQDMIHKPVTKVINKTRKAPDYIEKILDPTDPMTATEAAAEYDPRSNVSGRKRAAGFETMANALDTEIARVTNETNAKAARDVLAAHTLKGPPKDGPTERYTKRTALVEKKAADFAPERIEKLREARRELDPVGAAADDAERMARKARLAEEMKAKTKGADDEGSVQNSLLDDQLKDPNLLPEYRDYLEKLIAARKAASTQMILKGLIAQARERLQESNITPRGREFWERELAVNEPKLAAARAAMEAFGHDPDSRKYPVNEWTSSGRRTHIVQELHTTPGGIDPRSSRYYKSAVDPRLAANLMHWMRETEANGQVPMSHDGFRLIASDPVINAESPALAELARRLLRVAPNLPVHSGTEAITRGLMSQKSQDSFIRGNLLGYHQLGGGPRLPEHIMLATENEGFSRTHVAVTLLHEGLHSATHGYVKNLLENDRNHPHLLALEAIRKELLSQGFKIPDVAPFDRGEGQSVRYATTNPHEVITEAMSNPLVHTAMATMRGSPEFRATMTKLGFQPKEAKSVWSYFSDLVRKALSLGVPRSASEYTMLDYVMRPVQDIIEHGSKFIADKNAGLLPKDPVLREAAEPLYRSAGEAFTDQARGLGERALNAVDPRGRSAAITRGLMSTQPFDRLIDRYGHLAQDGEKNYLRDVRAAAEHATVATNRFLKRFSDTAGEISRTLAKHDDVAELMNDVGYARAALATNDAKANAHLTTPEQRAQLAGLQARFDAMSPEKQQLYTRTRDFLTDKHDYERQAMANNLVNRFMPNATPAEKQLMRETMRSKEKLDVFLADPDNIAIADERKRIARGMAELGRMGFVDGDYFPMRRYGDFVVEYGGQKGDPGYGVQFFERHGEAEALRRELATQGVPDIQQVRERDDIVRNRAMRISPVVEDMIDAVRKNPELREHAKDLEDLAARLQMQYATGQQRATAKRRYVAGASKDVARAIQTDVKTSALRVGAIEHSGERDAAMRALDEHAGRLARSGGDAFTLDQARHELRRRFEVGDQIHYSGSAGLARRLTAFGYAQSLMSFSRLATETAEMHLKMGAFIGARHGVGRASFELGRAIKDISPPLLGQGGRNTLKALIGKPLSSVDYQLSEMARQRLLDKGYDGREVDAFFKHFEDNGLFDQTTAQALKDLARPTGAVKLWDRFLDVNSAMSHASDEANRIAGAWAAFRAQRAAKSSIGESIRFAEDTLRKAPNFSPANRPRISTDKGVFGKFAAPIMQFKLYGLNEGWLLINMMRDTFGSGIDPAARKEAALQLTGTVMMHSLMAGALTWYADPARYIGGAYDLLTGNKPKDRTLEARAWLARSIGPTAGELLGAGLPHALGMDFQHRLGVNNMLNIPSLDGFTPKDWAEFAGHVALGAPGEDVGSIVTGFSKALQGDWLGGLKDALPRVLHDPVKAYDLARRGVVDTRGKQVLAPSKISPLDIAYQAVGLAPSSVSEARAGRQAILQARDAVTNTKQQLETRWLEAEPVDRAAVWSEIARYNASPEVNLGSKITRDQLLRQLQDRSKAKPGAFGLRLPKASERQLMQAGAFANAN